jgi:outer membrane protein assembly factor BamB
MLSAFVRWPAFLFLATSIFLAGDGGPERAENWPQWRGPRYDGTSREAHLPLKWSSTSGIVWKCPLPPWGNSTPAIWGDAIFVTTHVDNEKLLLLKVKKSSGRIEWTRQVGSGVTPSKSLNNKIGQQRRHQWFHRDQNYASPSPVTDGRVVVAHFGNGDLAAYDCDGNRLWYRNMQKDYGDYTIWWGHANSPVIFNGLVISACVQDNCADLPGERSPSYVVAHDEQTGKERWKTLRVTAASHEPCDSYTTPIFRTHNHRLEMIVLGGQMLDAYDPSNGKQLWYLPKLIGSRTISGPVATGEMIYAIQGMRQPLLAVRPGGDGERPPQDVIWRTGKDTPDCTSPVVVGQWLFMVNNDGNARCFDALSGKQQWKERLKGDYRASPLAGNQRIYFLNDTGLATVVAAEPKFQRLAENSLDEDTWASPIASDGRIYVRGRKTLYCLGE